MSFESNLRRGLLGESKIAKWLLKTGRCAAVLPAYEIEISRGKGPRLFLAKRQLVTPDAFLFGSNLSIWAEMKTKTGFTWYRKAKQWQDGIDFHHWNDYLQVRTVTEKPVWLYFYHDGKGRAKDTPADKTPPSGLFTSEVGFLERRIHHISDLWGRHGMVYWNADDLLKVATAEEVERIWSES